MKSVFYQANRNRIVEVKYGSIIVATGYSAMQRGNDAAFMFEQEANFWWLTGVEAPDWWLIIDGQRNKSWLVSPSVSEIHQIFDGSLSAESAKAISGVDGVLNHDEAIKMLRDLSKKHSVVYSLGDAPGNEYYDFAVNPAPKKLWRSLETIFNEVQDCRLELAKLRAIKQPEEITAIKKAIKLTAAAFNDVKSKLPTYRYEYEVEAEFTHIFRKNGAIGHAYDPIVASGGNACTLHYSANNDKLKPKSVLLLDIGARVDGYAADISRSYAIGEPTERQRQVHSSLQAAHKQIIKLLGPGLAVMDYYAAVDDIMKAALMELGLMSTKDDNEEIYRRYFPHAIGHGLGVDVHDSLGRATEFLPGMILTVEPGIYIPEEGIGMRIEDNILITDKGHTNLSQSLSTEL